MAVSPGALVIHTRTPQGNTVEIGRSGLIWPTKKHAVSRAWDIYIGRSFLMLGLLA